MLITCPPQQLPLAPSPPPPPHLPPRTRTTSMPAHYGVNVMSIFVEMGGFENQTAMLLNQSHSWLPGDVSMWRRCRVVQRCDWKGRAKEGCSWRKWKGTDTNKARLRWNKHREGKKPNRANDWKDNKRNGRKAWNGNQLSVNGTQRKQRWKTRWSCWGWSSWRHMVNSWEEQRTVVVGRG